jgi:flavin-dependent dehydrogenase
VQCSGLISKNLDLFVRPPASCIEHRVRGAVIHGPGGSEISLMKPGTAAYVIDREGFDRYLASRVNSKIRLNSPVKSLSYSGAGVSVISGKGSVRARAVIGCDGPSSMVRRHFRASPAELLTGIIAILPMEDFSDRVELWFDRAVCDGFLWRIPRGRSLEFGMLGSRVSFRSLEAFFSIKPGYVRRAGPIPVGPCKSYFRRTLLVGDAACQVKPWSGGGVVYGMTCAGHAVGTLTNCLESGDLSEEALSAYEDSWKAEIGEPISLGLMARAIYKTMPEAELEEAFRRLSRQDLNSLDMDFPLMGQ